MTIQDIKNILHAEILWADEEMLSHEVHTAVSYTHLQTFLPRAWDCPPPSR